MQNPNKPSSTEQSTDAEVQPSEPSDTAPSYDPHFPVGTDDFTPATGDGEQEDPLPF